MDEIVRFYGKFNEDKRLSSPYGRVEFLVTLHYLKEYTAGREHLKILDVGSGTGRYSIALSEAGHEVTAVDLVPYNVGILKQKAGRLGLQGLTALKGDAQNLKKLPSDAFDVVLLFGPMYHLFSEEDKVRALREAKRVLKPGGLLFSAYLMNDFAVIKFGFLEGHAVASYEAGKLSPEFHVMNGKEDLFSYDSVADLDHYNELAGLDLLHRFSQDGPTHYMRKTVSEMDEKTFSLFLEYVIATAERKDLVGASCHVADVLTK